MRQQVRGLFLRQKEVRLRKWAKVSKFGIRNYNAPKAPLIKPLLVKERWLDEVETERSNAPKVPRIKPLLGTERWLDEVETERSNAPKAPLIRAPPERLFP